jgi:hypothetical protein
MVSVLVRVPDGQSPGMASVMVRVLGGRFPGRPVVMASGTLRVVPADRFPARPVAAVPVRRRRSRAVARAIPVPPER